VRTWLLSGTIALGKVKREHWIVSWADEAVVGGPGVVASDMSLFMDQMELGMRVARLYLRNTSP